MMNNINELYDALEKECDVYVVSTDSFNPCKVGVAKSVFNRMKSLQGASARKFYPMACYSCPSIKQARQVEQEAHKILKANGKHLQGEWFDVRAKQACDAIEFAALTLGIEVECSSKACDASWIWKNSYLL